MGPGQRFTPFIVSLCLLAPGALVAPLEDSRAHAEVPMGSKPGADLGDDELGDVSRRIDSARRAFEQRLLAPAADLQVSDAARIFDDELVELAWELDRLDEVGSPDRPGSWRLLVDSVRDEIRLARARLDEVQVHAPELRILARLQVEMELWVEKGQPQRAVDLHGRLLPEEPDLLDWPMLVRGRLRDVDRTVIAIRSDLAEERRGAEPR